MTWVRGWGGLGGGEGEGEEAIFRPLPPDVLENSHGRIGEGLVSFFGDKGPNCTPSLFIF